MSTPMRTCSRALAALFSAGLGACTAPNPNAIDPSSFDLSRAGGDDLGAPADLARAGGDLEPPAFVTAPHRGFPTLVRTSAMGELSPMRLVVIVADGDPMMT
ncbi:MAG TPA: hypothetical protein VHB97_13780, partial [Polyangia bacterium]|nr:hypothetical protein [Polyangia bacterium]